VGGGEPVQVNVRMIATSNRDLAGDVRSGRFRPDLYYRMSGVHLTVPALRERKEDIPALVWHFVNQYSAEARRQIARLDPATIEEFRHYHWPGNVRELRNVVRTALILGDGPALSIKGLVGTAAFPGRGGTGLGGTGFGSTGFGSTGFGSTGFPACAAQLPNAQPGKAVLPGLLLQDIERQAVLEALRRTKRNQTKAAQLLGITDRTLREKIRRYRQNGLIPTAPEAPACGEVEPGAIGATAAGETRW
jgi:DNA-binding NtrC family response regulator